MLANKSFVRSIVNSIADMQGNSIYRRQWCDKTSVSDEERLLTFRFWSSKAVKLQVSDERDRTPYWLITTNNGQELLKALKS